METKKYRKNHTRLIIFFWLVNLAIWTPLFLSRCVWHTGYDDYYLHNMFAVRFWTDADFHITHPVYAILVGGIGQLLNCNVRYVAVLILLIAQIFSIEIGSRLFAFLNNDTDRTNKLRYLGLSFILNMIQPLILPGYIISPNSANGYVSPTQILCKPFTLGCIYLFFLMYEKKEFEMKKQFLLFLIMAVSGYIKPLFLMAFVPSMGILLWIDILQNIKHEEKTAWQGIGTYFRQVWPLFLGGIVLIIQYIQNINLVVPEDLSVGWGKDAPIRFGWMYAWKQVVPNVFVNILLAYALPIMVFILGFQMKYRNERLREFARMTLAYGIVSFFYISFLYQEGYATDLNFRNAWIVTFSFVYLIVILLLCKWNHSLFVLKEKNVKIVKYGLLFADLLACGHIVCGILMIGKNIIR